MPRGTVAHGETALHAALRRGDLSGARELVLASAGDERSALVNAKSTNGLTPLMLATLSPHASAEATARFLLEHGAAQTAGAHAGKRKTAADYAREHGLPALASTLQELVVTQRQQHADEAGTIVQRDPCESKAGRCVLCGDRMGFESKFAMLKRRLARPAGAAAPPSAEPPAAEPPAAEPASPEPASPERPSHEPPLVVPGLEPPLARPGPEPPTPEQVSSLVVDFFADPLVTDKVIAALSVPALHHINRGTRFSRELQEGLAMLGALRHCIRVLASGDGDGAGTDGQQAAVAEAREWHVVDLCCGKSYVSALISCIYPHYRLTAIDRVSPAYIPHYAEAGCVNVTYAQHDILADDFAAALGAIVAEQQRAGRRTVVLGMHLCGLLSLRAIELFCDVAGVGALVLAPCCLPAARRAHDTPPDVYTARDPAEQSARWCSFLEDKLRGAAPIPATCTRRRVEGMLSSKSTLLTAIRGRCEYAPVVDAS